MASGQVISKEESYTNDSGEVITQLSCKKPLYDEDGQVIGVVGNSVDISYLKSIESELQSALETYEKSKR